jgi:pSer/pThr/pTyr-binding forkhead associated (FHA) protein
MVARVVLSLDDKVVSEHELAKAVTLVGRHPDCDLVIEHPAVSTRHMLFRVVNRTVYAEDLASTNGTRVNGLSAHHQVVHHLDVIEVGKHKLHFFEDSMLAGTAGQLENTVLTEYERTMLAQHVPAPGTPPPKPTPIPRLDDELDRTQFIRVDSAVRLGPSHETVSTHPGTAPAVALALKVLAGDKPGALIALQRANTMIGTPGADTALVVRRGDAYYLARFSGQGTPRLNRRELGPGTHRISPQDVIDVGRSSFEVVLGT